MKKIILITISVLINLYFLYITAIYKQYPYSKLATLYNSFKMNLKSNLNSDEQLIDFIRASQIKNESVEERIKKIETNYLPLILNYIDLSKSGFAKVGGAFTSISENRIVIMDRLGYMYIYDNGLIKTKIQVPNNLLGFSKNYDGKRYIGTTTLRAFKIIFNPKSNELFASYSRYDSQDNIRMVVSSINISDLLNEKNNWNDIFVSEPFKGLAHSTQSGGGAITVIDNEIYLTIGFADDNIMNELSGKIISINLKNNEIKEISKGHRNSQGLVVLDDLNIMATEHGPQGGDEINVIKQGGNYGWPNLSLGTDYGTYNTYLEQLNSSKFTSPLFSFIPSIGISSIIQINSFNDKWKSNLLIGSLKAMTLKRILLKENRVIYNEDIFIGERIRDLLELENNIFILTDNSSIIKISIDKDKLLKNIKGDGLASLDESFVKCTSCHSFSNSNNSFGPNLENIKNREIGKSNYPEYSLALKNFNGFWTRENMESFLKDPQNLISGTKMANQNLTTLEIAQILKILYD